MTHYYQDEEAALPHIETALRKQIAADVRTLLRDLNPHRSEHDAGAWHGVSLALDAIEEGATK